MIHTWLVDLEKPRKNPGVLWYFNLFVYPKKGNQRNIVQIPSKLQFSGKVLECALWSEMAMNNGDLVSKQ